MNQPSSPEFDKKLVDFDALAASANAGEAPNNSSTVAPNAPNSENDKDWNFGDQFLEASDADDSDDLFFNDGLDDDFDDSELLPILQAPVKTPQQPHDAAPKALVAKNLKAKVTQKVAPSSTPSSPKSSPKSDPKLALRSKTPPTPEASKAKGEGELSITGLAALVICNRASITPDGAEKQWETQVQGKVQSKRIIDGLERDAFISKVQEPQVVAQKLARSVVMVQGYSASAGEIATEAAGNLLAQMENMPGGQKAEDRNRAMTRAFKSAGEHLQTGLPEGHNGNASAVTIRVSEDAVTIGSAGTASIWMHAKGATGKNKYMRPSDENGTIEPPKAFDTRLGLLSEGDVREGAAVSFNTGGHAIRIVAATGNTKIDELKDKYPDEFDQAFLRESAEDATAALKALYEEKIPLNEPYGNDNGIMVVDVTPEGVTPVGTPELGEVSAPPAPESAVPNSSEVLTGNRIIDAQTHDVRVRLLAAAKGGDLSDIAYLFGTDSKELQESIEADYDKAFDSYAKTLAERSLASAPTLILEGLTGNKKLKQATQEFLTALSTVQARDGLMIEASLKDTNPEMTDTDRDQVIEKYIFTKMFGGTRPMLTSGATEGVISALGRAKHDYQLEIAGWELDASGNRIAPQGLRKYAHNAVEKWADWAKQGKKGFVKRAGAAALAGAPLMLAGAVAAPVVGVGAVGVATTIATRLSKALVTTKLNKKSSTLNAAEQSRDHEITSSKLAYSNTDNNEAALAEFNKAATKANQKNALRDTISFTAAVGSAAFGGLIHNGLNSLFSGRTSSVASGHQVSGGNAQAASAPGRPTASADGTNTQQSSNINGGRHRLIENNNDAVNTTPQPEAPVSVNHNAVELSVHDNNQTIWDVVNHAKGGNLSQGQKWQMVIDSAKSAQNAGQLHTFYQPDGTYYYQALVNGHWTDNTTDVAKTLTKFSKGKLALAA